jgi:uncharacterized membrane protein YqjE
VSEITRVNTGDSVEAVSDTEPKDPGTSLGELMSRLGEDISGLVTTQLEIAKVEIKQEVGQTAKAAGMFGGGAFAGYLTILMLSFAAAWGLGEAFDSTWAGFFIVGIVWGIVAAILASMGKQRMAEVSSPEATAAELRADKQLAQDLRS